MFASGLLLAAGSSSRFGSPKMLAKVDGEPMLARSIRAFLDAGLDEVVVVLGANASLLASVIQHLPVHLVVNPAWEKGMFSSIRAGLNALSSKAGLVAVSPADLALLTADDIRRVLAAARELPDEVLTVPVSNGRRGHPLVFSSTLVPRILSWDDTARLSDLFREPDLTTHHLEGFGPGILHDVDRPSDLAQISETA
ncbi:MAG: nucleotidyltransferase family protein [Thermoanaerobaculia bacterium]